MGKIVEICMAFVSRRRFGNRRMVFDRLAWWLTKEGVDETTHLQDDRFWNSPLLVGYDAQGNPTTLPSSIEAQVKKALTKASSQPLPLAEAQALAHKLAASGQGGDAMTFSNKQEKARVTMLRQLYADRRRAWS